MRNEKIIKTIKDEGIEIRIIRDRDWEEFRVEARRNGLHITKRGNK